MPVLKTTNQAKLEALIGYHFRDVDLLGRALTHSSAAAAGEDGGNYERLEFLGDRVLGLIIAEFLCQSFPDAAEGQLSARLNMLVNAEICAEIADEIGLGAFIITAPEMKNVTARRMVNIHADVMESLIAALYIEGGLDVARSFIVRHWGKRARNSARQRRDAKTELQEWAQKQNDGALPVYRVVRRKGPDHDPIFEVEVSVAGFAAAGSSGSSKRQAEQAAAERILRRENVWK